MIVTRTVAQWIKRHCRPPARLSPSPPPLVSFWDRLPSEGLTEGADRAENRDDDSDNHYQLMIWLIRCGGPAVKCLSFHQVWQGLLGSSPAALTCLTEWSTNNCTLRRTCTQDCVVRGVWRHNEPYALEFSGPSWHITLLRTTFSMALCYSGAPRVHIIQEGNRVLEVEFSNGSCPWASGPERCPLEP